MVVVLGLCLCILLKMVVALANAPSLEIVGDIFVDSVSSSPELYNDSIRDLVAVKIRPEAVITYKFHVNVTLTQNPSHDFNLSLRILAGTHSVKDDCQMYFFTSNATEEKLDCMKQNDSVLLGVLQRAWNESSLNITGKFNVLTDQTSTGPIRTFIQIESFGRESDAVDRVTLFSEPVIKDWPRFGISPPNPPQIHMKNTTMVSISVTNLTQSLEDSYLKMYMPTTCEDCPNFEAQMSVVKLDLVSPTDINGRIHDYYQSRTRTTEYDAAIFVFDENDRESRPEVLQFSAQSELLDYRNFRNGDILEQAYGYKFKDEFIWVGETNITVLDDGHRNIPNIETALFELSNYEKFGEVSKRFHLNIEHSVNSTGSAYDVMAILYFQPDVSYVRYSQNLQNIVRNPEPSTEIDKKNVIFKIPRMSFVQPSKIRFNISYTALNGSTPGALSIVYEVVYRGWNDTDLEEDRSSQLQALTIAEGDQTEDNTLHCTCPWNRKQKCVCCKPGWCLCTQSKNPELCGPCQRPCSCVSDIKEYRKSSRLTYGNVTITCGDFDIVNRNQKKRAIGCQSFTSPGQKVHDLPPVVSTILGVDALTSYMYGLGNNGRGYVRSEDGGQSWVSVPPYVFHQVETSSAYKQARIK